LHSHNENQSSDPPVRTAARSRTGIIALVPDLYPGPWSTRHHVLTRLAEQFPVVWVEPSLDWRRQWLTRDGWRRRELSSQDQGSLAVLERNRWYANVYRPRFLRRAIRRARYDEAREQLLARGAQRIALYLWRPEFADALDLVQHDFSCYHIDDEYTFSATAQANTPAEVELIRRVDQVIVHSQRLLEKKGGINPRMARVPNGVDFAAYAAQRAEPADLAAIPHPRVGYVGVIKAQLDLDLMHELAVRRPRVSFVFVGPVGFLGAKAATWQRLTALPNVYALGNRAVGDLPAYTQHFDVCTMCYEVTDYTNAIFPLKLNEYLATGRPVVTSRIDAVLPFQNVVQIATTQESWLAAIDDALNAAVRPGSQVAARQSVARAHDWNTLVGQIAELFDPQQPVFKPDLQACHARTA
jgi:glycosyltransferase involved in cell wall biosynthesis